MLDGFVAHDDSLFGIAKDAYAIVERTAEKRLHTRLATAAGEPGRILNLAILGKQGEAFGDVGIVIGFLQRHQRAQRLFARDRRRHLIIRSEEHTSELQSLLRTSYAVF